jgi:hypothetical protein
MYRIDPHNEFLLLTLASFVRKASPDECWPWTGPRAVTGYGILRHEKVPYLAHRVAYAIKYGDPCNLYVLHKCDNPPCCNPRHLFKGTQADNIADMVAKGRYIGFRNRKDYPRGEDSHTSKLVESQARRIIELLGNGLSPRELSKIFPVHRRTIADIRDGKTWTFLPRVPIPKLQPPNYRLTPETVAEIKAKLRAGIKSRQLAKEYDLGLRTVFDIREGRTWGHVP